MRNVDMLLNEVKLFNKYLKSLQQTEHKPFNIFAICGVNHYENTHSSILAAILEYDDNFLAAFIETLKDENLIENDFEFSLYGVVVKREESTSKGRIDIVISNMDNQAILIENKIYASEQFEQLGRYEQFAKDKYEKYKLLYLTLYGSNSTSSNANYIPISHQKTVIRWLERCVQIASRNPTVRETLIQYINHLNILTNNTKQISMNQELINILTSSGSNIEAAFTIANNIEKLKDYLINEVFIPQIEQVCEEINGDIKLVVKKQPNISQTNWYGFRIDNLRWKQNSCILLEFQKQQLREPIIGVFINKEKVSSETFTALKQKFRKSSATVAYEPFPKYNNWGTTEAMVAIENGEMKELLKRKIEEILEKTKDIENL